MPGLVLVRHKAQSCFRLELLQGRIEVPNAGVCGCPFFCVCDPEEVLLKWFRESRPPDVQMSCHPRWQTQDLLTMAGWDVGEGGPSGPEVLAEFAHSGYTAGSHGQLCPPSMLTQIRPHPSAITYQMHISKLGQKSRSLNTDSEQIRRGGCLPELFHLNYVRNQKEPLTLEPYYLA